MYHGKDHVFKMFGCLYDYEYDWAKLAMGKKHFLDHYTVSGKNGTTLFLPLTLPVLANFQNSFTNRLSSKFPAMLS